MSSRLARSFTNIISYIYYDKVYLSTDACLLAFFLISFFFFFRRFLSKTSFTLIYITVVIGYTCTHMYTHVL